MPQVLIPAAVGVAGQFANNALTPRGTNAPTALDQASAQDQAWLRDTGPLRQAAALRAFMALDPSMMSDARLRAALMQRATQQGRIQGAQLRGAGYGDSLQAGALIGNQNRATSTANGYLTYMSSPEFISNAALGQMSALNAGQSGAIGQAQQQRAADQQHAANAPATPWEQIIGATGSTAPWWLPKAQEKKLPSTPSVAGPGFSGQTYPTQGSWQDPSQYRWNTGGWF